MNPQRRNDALARLKHLGEQTAARGECMAEERGRFAALATRHTDGTAPVAVAAFQLFQTPPELAARMVALAGLADGMRVLEPSAGLGRILDAIASDPARVDVVAVEQSPDCCRQLYQQRRACTLKQGDFLHLSGSGALGAFDRVIMNPPFKNGLDYVHTMAAARLLSPGGRLVGLCYDGAKSGRIQALATSWERITPGAFRDAGTMAGVCLFTIDNN